LEFSSSTGKLGVIAILEQAMTQPYESYTCASPESEDASLSEPTTTHLQRVPFEGQVSLSVVSAENTASKITASALTPKQQVSRMYFKRSGGPNTRRGREIAASNAFKHGAYQRVFKQDEAYAHFKLALMDDLVPDGAIQCWHAERIVEEMWRLTLLGQNTLWIEQRAFDLQEKEAKIISSFEKDFQIKVPANALAFFMDYEKAELLSKDAAPLFWAHARFVVLQAKGFDGLNGHGRLNLEQADPDLYAFLYGLYKEAAQEALPPLTHKEIQNAFESCVISAFEYRNFAHLLADPFAWQDARGQMWVAEYAPEIAVHIQAFVARRYLHAVSSETRMRAQAHLTRTLQVRWKEYRALKTSAANAAGNQAIASASSFAMDTDTPSTAIGSKLQHAALSPRQAGLLSL